MYFLDLLGTFAFAVTGAYKAKGRELNVFGVIILGVITAVGGGTFRDLMIGRTPLFYLKDPNYFLVGILAGLLIYVMPTFFKRTYSFFRFIDSVGLAVFVIIGASVTSAFLFEGQTGITVISFLVCTFGGMISGFGGGVIRDAIMGDEPFALKKGSNYIFCAFLGSASFYVISFVNINLAVSISMILTLYFREITSKFGIYQRVILNNVKSEIIND
ncbi:MAG: TRIC cation channel family protein [Candidatus Moranbacteria bacterium]|nr:TRIC cation channel family protein [Candidatus Moranbacteria bacterium]